MNMNNYVLLYLKKKIDVVVVDGVDVRSPTLFC